MWEWTNALHRGWWSPAPPPPHHTSHPPNPTLFTSFPPLTPTFFFHLQDGRRTEVYVCQVKESRDLKSLINTDYVILLQVVFGHLIYTYALFQVCRAERPHEPHFCGQMRFLSLIICSKCVRRNLGDNTHNRT